ncbi:MAG: hypothetical protein ACPHY8_03095 [Patescibacteria group bacterium]
MNINKRKIMITTAILATIGGSLLFASQNYDIQPNHQNIQNVVSILEAPSKTETKINTKNPENNEGKTQPLFHPDFPDYEIFEQTEIEDIEKTKGNSISENYDVYGQNYIHHFRKNSEFIQSKIRADGLVPLMEKKFNLQEPFYDAILGVKPGEFYVGAYPFSQNKTNLIEYFQEITGLKIISYKKGEYFSNEKPSYNLIIDLEGVTQYEIYLIRKNMMNNHTDIFMSKKYIVLPEYQNTEILNSYGDYIENMSTMGD